MDTLFGLAVVVGLVVAGAPFLVWALLSSRIRRMEEEQREAARVWESNSQMMAGLVRRVYELEKARVSPVPAPVHQAPLQQPREAAPVHEPVIIPPIVPPIIPPEVMESSYPEVDSAPEVLPREVSQHEAAHHEVLPPPLPMVDPIPHLEPTAHAEKPEEPVAPVFAAASEQAKNVPLPESREAPSQKAPAQKTSQEWEMLVGGNWVLKAGVLSLVIGLALLLGYGFTQMGPAGRVGIGFAVGLTMLLGGMWWERKPVWALFARGLMGGGWAALYFTTYAMYGVEAAKVIDNPYVATTLLLAVASGMIVHSLRYKSQTASGLAYFIAFATLRLSESTPFSVLALLPLAGSLLYLANKFEWYKMAVFGLFATYATVASRPDTGAALSTTQALFGCYWLLFESFDLLRLRKRPMGARIESLIFPFNALGFLSLSLVKWHRTVPEHLYLALSAGAALYLVSALLRTRLRPPGSFDEGANTFLRILGGGYEGPLTIAAGLAAAAIVRGFSEMWAINLGLLVEGEVLFLAGVWFGQVYLRQLAGVTFAGFLMNALWFNRQDDSFTFAGRQWLSSSRVGVLAALVFYGNRLLRVAEGAVYTTVAAGLITLVLGAENSSQYVSVAWMIFALVLFELGFVRRAAEFRFQSYAVAALGAGAGLMLDVFADVLETDPAWTLRWLPLAVAALVLYAIAIQIQKADWIRETERRPVVGLASAGSVLFLIALVWKLAPTEYLGAAWILLGAVLFELGLRGLPKQFRGLSYLVLAAGFADVVWVDVLQAAAGAKSTETISLLIATLVAFALSARVFRSMPERIGEQERGTARDVFAAVGTLFALALLWLQLPAQVVVLAWAAVGLLLLEAGFAFSLPSFRALGNAVAVVVCGRLFLANFGGFDLFRDFDDAPHLTQRSWIVLLVMASQYYTWLRYRRHTTEEAPDGTDAARLYLYVPPVIALVLARLELGSMLTVVAWALLALVLYAVGHFRNLIDLRWQSYAIAVLAFGRCWSVNFFLNESISGISARVLTAAVVIASFYAAQLLSPRTDIENGRLEFIDRYARTFYSLLASVLLAGLLFYEVSGGLLTMAWGIEALTLLGAGFPLRDRLQRLSGLFLFFVCLLKLFLYDLRQLETVNRILSFIVLGVILVGVSWMYTRFRDRIQRYL